MCSVKDSPFVLVLRLYSFMENGCLGGWRESLTGRARALWARGSESDPQDCGKTARLTSLRAWNPRSEEAEAGRLTESVSSRSQWQTPSQKPKVEHHLMLSSSLHMHVHTCTYIPAHRCAHTQTWKKKTDVSVLCPKTTIYRNLLFMQEEVRPRCHYSTIMDLKI